MESFAPVRPGTSRFVLSFLVSEVPLLCPQSGDPTEGFG